ncbi:hypothetical protein LTS17_009670 [Exophiala oligosperma]
MPTLKNLVCNVLWGETGAPFPEYGTQYGDGFVETFIAIPNHPQPFSIRLTSRKFIHEGLAMLVFIDGKYQCNRVRVNLQSPEKNLPESRSKIDFIVRQKETRLGDGSYMGREWRFDDYNVVQQLPPGASESHFEELGTIEVFVLRCSSNDPAEFDSLSDSSKEDSVILEQQDDDNAEIPTEQSAEVVAEPDLETLPFWGIFDGPSDRPSSSHFLQVDGPADNYHHWDFGYRPGPRPYPPQQGPRYPPRPYQQEHVPGGTFHYRRPTQDPPQPPPRGERDPHDHLPPRPERRVHFDYGSPREGSVHNGRYQSQPMPRFHDDYYPPQHYVGHQPYGDYPSRHAEHQYVHRPAEPRDYRDYPEPPMGHGALRVPLASSSRIPGLSERGTTLPTHARMGSVPPQVPPHPPGPAPLPYTGIQPFPSQHPLPMPTWIGPPHQAFQPAVPGPAQFFPYLPLNTAPWFQVPNQPIPQNTQITTTSTGTSASNDTSKQKAASTATVTNTKAEFSEPTTKDSNNNATNNTWPDWNTQNKSETDKNTNKPDQDQIESADQGTSNANDNQDWNNDNNNNNSSGQNWDTNNNNSNNTTDQSWDTNNNNNSGNATDQGWDTNNNNNSGNTTDQSWDTNNNNNSGNATDQGWDTVNNNSTSDDNKSNKSNQNWSQGQNTTSNNQNVPQSTSNASGKTAWYGPYGLYQAAKFHRDVDVPPIAEEEPRYDVPQSVAQAKGVTKQVQPGRGYIYNKKSLHPAKYLDTLQDPYARFIFKYRHKEQIKAETGIVVSLDPSPDTNRNALEGKSKDELIELVLRAKGALGGDIPDQPPPKPVPAPAVPAPFEQVPIAPPQHPFPTYYLPAFRRPSVQASSSGAKPTGTTNITAAAAADQGWGSGNTSNAAEQQNNNWQQGGEASDRNSQQASGTGRWDGQNEEEPAAARSYPPHDTAPSNPTIPAPSAISPLNLPGPSYPTSVPVQQDRVCTTPNRPSAADADPPPPPSPLYQSSSGSPAIVRSVPLSDPFGPSDVAEPRTEPLPDNMRAPDVDDPVPAGFSSWDRYFMHPNSPDIPDEYVHVPIVDAPDRPPDPPPMSRQPAPGEPHDFWL